MNTELKFKKILVMIALSFGVSTSLASEFSQTDLTGKALVQLFAATCSESAWSKLKPILQKESWLKESIATPVLRPLAKENKIQFPEQQASVSLSENSDLVLEIRGQKFSAKDPCELVLMVTSSQKSSAYWVSLLMPTAFARDLVQEQNTAFYRTAEFIALIVGIGIIFAPATLTFTLVAGVWVASAAIATSADKCLEDRHTAHAVLNQKFKLFCSENSVTIEGEKARILYTRIGEMTTPYDFSIVELGPKPSTLVKNGQSGCLSESKKFVRAIGERCKNATDAQKILNDLKTVRDTAQKRMDELTIQRPKAPSGASAAQSRI